MWAARIERDLGEVPQMLCELKIDGLAVDLVYRNGRLATLATRGDGRVGEDVTYNARFIPAIPQHLVGAPPLVEVRGEVYFPVVEFAELNEQMLDLGRSPFANPRNAGAGTLRQRVDRRQAEIAEREASGKQGLGQGAGRGRSAGSTALGRLRLIVHGLGVIEGQRPQRLSQAYEWMAAWGLPVSEQVRVAPTLAEVEAYVDAVRGQAALPRARDRRGCGEGRRSRRPAATGCHVPGTPLGDRGEVPAGGGAHPAAGHRGQCRAHRPGDPVRGDEAGAGVRHDGVDGHAAQRPARSSARAC